jgi:Transglycosylase SLT domain/Putative peptidoglycan binding domain
MQRRLALAAALLLAALTFSAPAEARVNPQNAGLQVALRAWGTYLGRIDGIAGPMTARAVRVFQRRAGLPVDGVPGKRTRRAMGRLGKPLYGKRAMHRGMVGWDVAVLQFMLARRGSSPGIVDGYFGKETGRALRRFQRRHGLHADSVAGAATRRALGGGVAASGRAGPRSGRTVKAKLNYWARVYTMSPRFVRAIAWVESGWQKGVVSPKGARGVMQVMPGTWSYVQAGLIGHPVPRTTDGNIQIGVVYIRHLYRHYNGNVRLALAAYNQGPGSLRKRGMYRETRQYVRNVLAVRGRV